DLITNDNDDFPRYVGTLALSPDGGTLYAGGSIHSGPDDKGRSNALALRTDTAAVTDWDPRASDPVEALAVSPDGGTVYVGGFFGHPSLPPSQTVGGADVRALAGTDATTGRATSFLPSVQSKVVSLALSADGQTLYASGV